MTRLPLAALLSLWIGTANAAPTDTLDSQDSEQTTETESSSSDAKSRRGVFPSFRRKAEEAKAERAVEVQREEAAIEGGGVDEEEPASDAPSDGIWEWVGRMDGEVPSSEQVEAIEELSETELSERALVDELSGASAPEQFYKDPVAALTVDPLHLDRVDPSEFDIPIVVNDEVRMWVKYFTGPGRKYYTRWLGRSTRFRPMMYRELDKAGLPRDLVYLSMIESGYNAHAYSHASAAGLWQFIPSTARLYKMRVDFWVDDRRDPERSLEGAIDFLGELHKMFGDWQLAWASYNTGPGRVRRAVSKSGTKDFYTIARSNYLHPETENYVPKIMAAAIIGKHPERYGFEDITYQEELKYEVSHVDGSVELSVLAVCAGTDTETLKALNPALRRFATPPEGYDVRLPIGSSRTFVAELAKVPKNQRVTVMNHTVARGQTLSSIAAKYGVSVSAISQANNLRNVNRITVGMSLVIPGSGRGAANVAYDEEPAAKPAAPVAKSTPAASSVPSTYTVRKGDTLSTVAQRYGQTVSALQSRNGMKGSTIYVGQVLKLGGSGGASTAATASAGGSTTKYTVKSGDTLSSIATKHSVRTADLQQWNGISNPSHIRVGQELSIKGSSASWTTHTVKSGDSLGKIATNNSCSVTDLQQWNNLSGSVIHPGQKLKIRAN